MYANEVKDNGQETFVSIIRMKKVQELTGLSRTTIWRKVQLGEFPVPLKLTANTIGFYAHEIEEYLLSLPRATNVKYRS